MAHRGGYRTRTRQVWRTQRVDDARCASAVSHTPLAGGAYLVQFDFYGHARCTAQCFRQLSLPDGQFRLVPCGPGEPPVEVAGPIDEMTPEPWWRPAAQTLPAQTLPAQTLPAQTLPAQSAPAQPSPAGTPETTGGDDPSGALGTP
jgi:hypothetical protein